MPGQDKGPYVDPEKAKMIQDSAMQSGFQPAQWWANIKAGLGVAGDAPAAPPAVSVQPPVSPSAASGVVDPEKAALAQESMRRAMPQGGSGEPSVFDGIARLLSGDTPTKAPAAQGPSSKKPDRR